MKKIVLAIVVLIAGCGSPGPDVEGPYLREVEPIITQLAALDRTEDAGYTKANERMTSDSDSALKQMAGMLENVRRQRRVLADRFRKVKAPDIYKAFHAGYLGLLDDGEKVGKKLSDALKPGSKIDLGPIEVEANELDKKGRAAVAGAVQAMPTEARAKLVQMLQRSDKAAK